MALREDAGNVAEEERDIPGTDPSQHWPEIADVEPTEQPYEPGLPILEPDRPEEDVLPPDTDDEYRWWQYREEYPTGDEEEELAPPDVLNIPEYAEQPYEMGLDWLEEEEKEEEPSPMFVSNAKKWFNNQSDIAVDWVVDTLTLSQGKKEKVFNGPGLGSQAVTAPSWARKALGTAYDYTMDLTDEIKTLVGFWRMTGAAETLHGPIAGSTAMEQALIQHMMQNEEFAESIENQPKPYMMDEDSWRNYKESARAGAEKYREVLEGTGRERKAMREAVKLSQSFEVKGGKVFTDTPSGNYILPFTENSERVWEFAKGYRYTHGVNAEEEKRFWDYIEAGMNPQQAGDLTERPFLEMVGEIVLDPYTVIPVDDLIFTPLTRIAGAGLKKAAGWGLDLLARPSWSPVAWAIRKTSGTQANYAARAVGDSVQYVKGYADEAGEIITPKFLKGILDEPTEELVEGMSKYYLTEFGKASGFSDEVLDVAKRFFDGDAWDETIELATKQLKREGVDEITDSLLRSRAVNNVWEEFVNNVSSAAYGKTLTDAAQSSKLISKAYLDQKPVFRMLLEGNEIGRSTMVDMWLGMRPSWNLYNRADNSIKLIMSGVNPFVSLKAMAQRYVDYSPDTERAVKAADELPTINMFNFRNNKRTAELYDDLTPQAILQSFAESRTAGEEKSILRAFGPTRKWIEWNQEVATRIEQSGRAKGYFYHFFDYLDDGWRQSRKQFLSGDNPLSDDAVDVLQRKLDIINPTTDKVQRALSSVVEADEFVFVKPEIGDDYARGLFSVPDGVKNRVSNRLRLRAGIGPDGPQAIRKTELREVFEEGVDDIVSMYDESVDNAIRSLDDTLPAVPENVDEALEILVPEGEEKTIGGLVKAINDFPTLGKRASLENTKMRERALRVIDEARQEGLPASEIGKMWDEWAFETNPQFWDEFLTKQDNTLSELSERLNSIVDTPIPDDYFGRYMEAARSLSALNVEKFQEKKVVMNVLRHGGLSKPIREQLFETTTKKWDEIYQTTTPQLIDEMHRSLVGVKDWLEGEGIELSEEVMQGGMTKVGWDIVDDRIDNISKNAWENMEPALKEMKDWYEYTLSRRNTPYSEVEFTEEEIEWLVENADSLVDDAGSLVSEAQTRAIRKVNHFLFDYETTRNIESLLHQVVPFVRYPTRNLPLWVGYLVGKPKVLTSIVKVREAQAAYNQKQGLPRRMWYTAPIPYSTEVLEMFGIADAREQRFNPWSFLSLMSSIPGTSPFKQRQLQNLAQEYDQAESPGEKPGELEVMTELGSQMGLSLLPGLDFMLGSMGFLGDDWYPNGFTGGLATTADWIVREVTDYERDFSLERTIWETVPTVFNEIFGGTELSFENVNADLFEEWATGRELETVIMRLDEDVVRAIDITPTDARSIVRNMDEDIARQLRVVMKELVKADSEQQMVSLENMGEEEKAVFMLELQRIANRRAVREQALTALLGHFTIFTKTITEEEKMATKTRYKRRKEKESMAPGQERRDVMKQWYEEHPKYGLIQSWRFGQHQWAETEIGEEIEEWDSIIGDYESKYYDYNSNFQDKKKKVIARISKEHPLDTNRLNRALRKMYEEKDEYTQALNEELVETLEAEEELYIQENPNDKDGIRQLKEGWETDIYVGTHLTDEDRETLSKFRQMNPEDKEGYDRLFRELYEQRREESPPIQSKKVPGLDEDIKMDLEWTPVGDEDYTEEEVRNFLVGELLDKLHDGAPDKDDYETYDEWKEADNEFLDNLPEMAMETDQAKRQVNMLVETQDMTRDEAKETVSGWYTEEELYDSWQRNDTLYEALNNVYVHRWEDEADEEFFNEVLPIKDEAEELRRKSDEAERAGNIEEAGRLEDKADELFALYMMRQTDLEQRYGERPATEFVRYIMDEYPGRWTALELRRELEGTTVPGYFERLTLRKSGSDAVNAHIKNYYYDLSVEDKMAVRQTFGPKFSDIFLEQEDAESLDIRLRGAWLDSLTQMYGEDLDWTNLPGVDIELQESQMAEANEKAGLPNLTPQDFEEFEEAQKLNRRYWELRQNGQEGWKEIEKNPLWDKYFDGNSAKSYFWDIFYDKVPPYNISEKMREHTLVQFILDKDVRTTAATNSDYDRASKFMLEWYADHQDDIRAAGLNPEDYDLVRKLNKEFFAIPEEAKGKRRAFLEQHPILIKYWEASLSGDEEDDYGGSYGGGGGGYSSGSYSSGSSENYKDLWTAFRNEVGQSLPTVIRMLEQSQNEGEIPESADKFLRSLHSRLDVDMEFEEWLSTLWYYWQKYGVSGKKLNVPSLRNSYQSFSRPRYEHRTRGIRRIKY